MIAVQEIGLAGYDQRMRTRQSHIVPAHMRHLDGRIVPLAQRHSAGNPSESLMTAIFLTPPSEQLHAYANAKVGHTDIQHGFLQLLVHAPLNRPRIAVSATATPTVRPSPHAPRPPRRTPHTRQHH